MAIRIGILTVSDRASRGVYEDIGGPAIRDCLTEILSCAWEPVARVIPDERQLIEETLIEMCDRENCCLVVTTGGTGLAPRDVTPEATAAVVEKEVPGLAELMRHEGMKTTPRAALSRARAGVRKKTLILNLPGSVKGVREALGALSSILSHALEVVSGNTVRCGG